MSRNLSTSVRVRWADGQEMEKTLEDPKWEEPQRSMRDEEVADKFRTLAGSVLDEGVVGEIVAFTTGLVDLGFADLVGLLRR